MLPLLTTPEDTGIPNEPNELCAELGREMVRLCLNNEQPKDMCGDCAFRLGSAPNRSATAHDAMVCLIEDREFVCHHGEDRPCAGFQRAHKLKCLSMNNRIDHGQASLTESGMIYD